MMFPKTPDPITGKGRVLFCGHSFYHTWYLSRELRKLGWRADVLNTDANPQSQSFYHGEDFTETRFRTRNPSGLVRFRRFLRWVDANYDVVHFSNAWGMTVPFSRGDDPTEGVRWLKSRGKKIVYSNNGCLDGATQSGFSGWGEEPVCDVCRWKNDPTVCSDERNAEWGRIRNELADYQCTTGGNRVDFNSDPRVHEVPEFYCMDPDHWDPGVLIPSNYRLAVPAETVKVYHSVGNYSARTHGEDRRNIKSTHIYVPLMQRMKDEGFDTELVFFSDVPSRQMRYYQLQADIVADMLTFGWFGANGREAMMLGKPFVCYIRPEWLAQVREQLPEYAEELPVVSATPETVHEVLAELIADPDKRADIGRRSREFALKWHSSQAGAQRMDRIYSDLLGLPR
ncbi:MAG: glycosyltransferase family 1 protein [Actinobacteria bacterium]|nr:glycosyltransferase family 1 protein [Actinomycetota bacterium]